MFHAILHQSTVIHGISFAVLFIGLLAELTAILDIFIPIPQDYFWLGVMESHKVVGINTSSSDTSIMDALNIGVVDRPKSSQSRG